jgi:hypothetical protein
MFVFRRWCDRLWPKLPAAPPPPATEPPPPTPPPVRPA